MREGRGTVTQSGKGKRGGGGEGDPAPPAAEDLWHRSGSKDRLR